MTTKELQAVRDVLTKVGPAVNPFRDEALAYVTKDLAIRAQQRKDMRDMNRGDGEEYPRWPFGQ